MGTEKSGHAVSIPVADSKDSGSLIVTQENVDEYLSYLASKKGKEATIKKTVFCFRHLFSYLPESKEIQEDTLGKWEEYQLNNGVPIATIVTNLNMINGYLKYVRRWDLIYKKKTRIEKKEIPVLSKEEYVQVLNAAKTLRYENAYILIEVFAMLGVTPREIPQVTVEALNLGCIKLPGNKVIRIPSPLREELHKYAQRHRIHEGAILFTKEGNSILTSSVREHFRIIAQEACVDEKKVKPTYLRFVYKKAYDEFFEPIHNQAKVEYEKLLEQECEELGVGDWTWADV